MYAAHYGHYNIIRILTQYSCLVDYQDQIHGRTALMLAASNGHTRSIETLLTYGKADRSLTDFTGNDAFQYAKNCGHGNNKMIKALLGREKGHELRGRSHLLQIGANIVAKNSSQFHESENVNENSAINTTHSNCFMKDSYSSTSQQSQTFFSLSSIWRPIVGKHQTEKSLNSEAMNDYFMPTTMPPQAVDTTSSSTESLKEITLRLKALEERVKFYEQRDN